MAGGRGQGPRLNLVENVVVIVAMVKPMHIAGSRKLIQSVKYEGSILSTYGVLYEEGVMRGGPICNCSMGLPPLCCGGSSSQSCYCRLQSRGRSSSTSLSPNIARLYYISSFINILDKPSL